MSLAAPGLARTFPCLLLALLVVACGQDEGGRPRHRTAFYTVDDLGGIVLHRSEAPEGTEFRRDVSGPASLKRFWPSACCLGVQAEFEEADFQTARLALFEKPGHSDDPIDTRPGWEVVSSSAVLFLTDEGASDALDVWVDYYRAPVLEPIAVSELGDEAVGLAGSPAAPAERMYLFVWRRGRLLLGLRASTGAGTIPIEQVRRLVDRMDARAS